MNTKVRVAATLIAVTLGLTVNACGSDAPIPTHGECFEGKDGGPCGDAGKGGTGGSTDTGGGGNSDTGGSGGGKVCLDGTINCNGSCVHPATDNANCGGCDHICSSTTTCQNGTCTGNGGTGGDGGAGGSGGTVTCTLPEVNCSNVCVNRSNDSANCGTCGHVCSSGTTCVAGVCKSGGGGTGGSGGDAGTGGSGGDGGTGCDGLKVKCGGICVDMSWDSANCGACGNTCTGGTTCQSGSCLPCPVGTWNCYTTCVDLKTDNNNCGGCGVVCAPGKTCHAQAGPPWGLCY